jgi:Fe-S cluster assembly protein SufD
VSSALAAAEVGAWRRDFDAVRGRVVESAALRERRAHAFARFEERGFPTLRDEGWRYTNVAPIAQRAFLTPGSDSPVPADLLASVRLPGFDGVTVVFVNGRHAPQLSSAIEPGRGVEVGSVRDAWISDPARLESWLPAVSAAGSAFADLNAALHQDGAFVAFAPGATDAPPVHLVFLSTGAEVAGALPASHPRSLIVAGRGSEGKVVVTHAGPDGEVYFANSVTSARIEEGASLDHVVWQRQGTRALHVSALEVTVERNGRFRDRAILMGAALARQETSLVFAGEGGECTLDGLFMADGDRLTDVQTTVDHRVPHCTSRELYKGVLDGRARGVWNGLVRVRAGAQKTDAVQSNKNLLLSREALAHSTPQLEILADDVKCKHGSTTGQLDPTALFYLRSRGISEADARGLLSFAFASEVVRAVSIPALREAMIQQVESRLGRAPAEDAA